MTMVLTVTNDSLILLLGLVVVGLILGYHGCCKEGGDAVEIEQQQQQQQQHEDVLLQEVNQDEAEDDEALDEILQQEKDEDETRNRDHDDALEETIQDQTEDEACGNEALLEEILNQEEEEANKDGAIVRTTNGFGVVAQVDAATTQRLIAIEPPPPQGQQATAADVVQGALVRTPNGNGTALDGTILVQQQYRVPYNLTHMRTIFRNPNPGMLVHLR